MAESAELNIIITDDGGSDQPPAQPPGPAPIPAPSGRPWYESGHVSAAGNKDDTFAAALDEAIRDFDQKMEERTFFDEELSDAEQRLAEALHNETEERADQQKEQYDAHLKALDEQAKQLKLDQEQREKQQRFAMLPEAQPASFMDIMTQTLAKEGRSLGMLAGMAGMPQLGRVIGGLGLLSEALEAERLRRAGREEQGMPEAQPGPLMKDHEMPRQFAGHAQTAAGVGAVAQTVAPGAAAGIGAAVPVVQGALMLRQASQDFADSMIKAQDASIQYAGNVGAAAAALDPRAMSQEALKGVESFASTIGETGLVGKAVEQQVKMYTGLAQVGMKFHDALLVSAEQLKEFSPAVMVADAHAEIRRMQGGFKRGAMLGDDLGAFLMASTRANEAGKDVLAEMLKPFLPRAVMALEKVAGFMEQRVVPAAERIGKNAEEVFQAHERLYAQLYPWLPFVSPALAMLMQWLKVQAQPVDEGTDSFLDHALSGGGWNFGQPDPDNAAREAWWDADMNPGRPNPADWDDNRGLGMPF